MQAARRDSVEAVAESAHTKGCAILPTAIPRDIGDGWQEKKKVRWTARMFSPVTRSVMRVMPPSQNFVRAEAGHRMREVSAHHFDPWVVISDNIE